MSQFLRKLFAELLNKNQSIERLIIRGENSHAILFLTARLSLLVSTRGHRKNARTARDVISLRLKITHN